MKARLAVALLALILLALAITFHRPPPPPPEPTFGGRTLTQWVLLNPNALNNNPRSIEAREAIRAIGTNALPCLLAWLSADRKGNPIRAAAERLTAGLPDTPPFRSVRNWASSDPAMLHFEMAAYLFATLGPIAAPAVPDLERLACDPRGRRSAYIAIHCLGGIGPQALPALQRVASNPACPACNEAAREAKHLLTKTNAY